MKKIVSLLFLLLVVLVFTTRAQTNFYWNNTSGNWNTLSNWRTDNFGGSVTPTVLPHSGDNVYIGSGSTNATVVLNVSDTINNLKICGSGQIFINTSNSSVLSVWANLTDTNSNNTGGGSATIKFCGAGTQSLIGGHISGRGKLPNITVDKTGSPDSLNLSKKITMGGSTTLNYVHGTITPDTSSLVTFYYTTTISGSWSFNDVEFTGTSCTFTISNTITVNRNLTYDGSSWAVFKTGTINVNGNIYNSSTNSTWAGVVSTAVIKTTGTSQTYYGPSARLVGLFPNLTISSGTLSLNGFLTMDIGTTLTNSGGTVSPGTSTTVLYNGNAVTGNITLNNVEIVEGSSTFTFSDTLTVNGTLTLSSTSWAVLKTGTIKVLGDIYDNNTYTSWAGTVSTATIKIAGTANQTLYGPSSRLVGFLPNITIKKSSDTLRLKGCITINVANTLNYVSGIVAPDTSHVILFNGNTVKGNLGLTNVEIVEGASTFSITDTLTVNGNLTLSGSSWMLLNTGTIKVYGNIYNTNTYGSSTGAGSATIQMVGGNTQTLAGASSAGVGLLPNFLIKKSGSNALTLSNYIAVGNFVYASGTVSLSGSTIQVYGSSLNGQGTSTLWLNNLILAHSATLAGQLKVTGSLTINSGQTLNTSSSGNYTIEVQGDFINNGTYTGNNSTVTFSGGNLQRTSGSTATTMYNLAINKSAGVDSIKESLSISNNLTFTKGNIVTTSSNLLIINNGATVTGASDSSFVSGPVKKVGNSAFTFPIGGNGHYRLLGISSQASTTEAFTAAYNHAAPATGTLGSGVTQLDNCDYWYFEHTTGSNSVNITLNTSNTCFNFFSISHSTISYLNGGTWTSGGAVSTSGTNITSTTPLSNWGDGKSITVAKTNPLIYASGSTVALCTGQYASISGSASGGTTFLSYAWSPVTALSSSTTASPSASPTTQTTYTVTVTDAIGENASAAVIVNVNALPGNNAGTSQTFCNTASATIGTASTSGHTYSWAPSTGLSSSTASNPTASVTATTTYTLTETISATGCSTANNVVITVNPLPGNNTGSNVAICNGSSTTIGASSTSGHTYSWSPSSGLSSSTVSNPIASPTTTTTYTLTEAITSTGCYVANTVVVTVNPLPGNNVGTNQAICNSSSTTIGASITSGHAYIWSPSTGLSISTVSNPTASPTTTTTYTLTETIITTGCSAVHNATVIVNPNPIVNSGSNFLVCKNSNYNIGGTPTASGGTPPYSYLWKNIHGDSLFCFANPFIIVDSSIKLYLTVTDSNKCHTKDSTQLIMATPINISSHIDTILYKGQSIVLNPSVSGGMGHLNYTWSPKEWLNDSTIRNPTATPLSSIQYIFRVTDSAGCFKQIYPMLQYSLFNSGALNTYAVFAANNIGAIDTSIAIGNIGSKSVDFTHFKIQSGFVYTDTSLIDSLSNELSALIGAIDTMTADTISGNLSADTLYSGTYYIGGNASLNGTLTLAGNDSSYFIFRIDSAFTIQDSSKIILEKGNRNKIYFAVRGNIQIGYTVELEGNFLCRNDITIGTFKGAASMKSQKNISYNGSSARNEAISPIVNCTGGIYSVQIPDSPPINQILKSGYVLVFDDEFNDASTLNLNNWEVWQECESQQYHDYNSVEGVVPTDQRYDWWVPDYDNNKDNFILNDPVFPGCLILRDIDEGNSPPYESTPVCRQGYFRYHTPVLRTLDKFYHGVFEISAKMPPQYGEGCGFWTILCNTSDYHGGLTNSLTGYREIDFFDQEMFHKDFLHSAQLWVAQGCTNGKIEDGVDVCIEYEDNTPVDLTTLFHVYDGAWNGTDVTSSIDGTITNPGTSPNGLTLNAVDEVQKLIIAPGEIWDDHSDPGFTNPRDFVVDYARVWQLEGHVFDTYFVQDCNGNTFNPTYFPKESDYSYRFHIETSYYVGASYTWSSSSPGVLFTQSWGNSLLTDDKSMCYFYCNTPGTYTITLNATLPEFPNIQAAVPETHSVTIVIGSDPLPTLDAPTSSMSYTLDGSSCHYTLCLDNATANASGYLWTINGNDETCIDGTLCTDRYPYYSDNYFCAGQTYTISVAAVNPETYPYLCISSSKTNYSIVLPGNDPHLSTPDVEAQVTTYGCTYQFCITTPVPNATEYWWENGGTWYGPYTSLCYDKLYKQGESYDLRIYAKCCSYSSEILHISGTLPSILSTPTISYQYLGNCEYQFCIDAVPNASNYIWSFDGVNYGSPTTTLCSSNYSQSSSYNISVQALTCNGATQSSVGNITGTLPAVSPPSAPTITVRQSDDPCYDDVWVDAVPGATSYELDIYHGLYTPEHYSGTSIHLIEELVALEGGVTYTLEANAINCAGESSTTTRTVYLDKPDGCDYRLEVNSDSTKFIPINSNNMVKIYPSPSNGSVTIENDHNKNVLVEVYAVNGISLVKNSIEAANKLQINDLPEGVIIIEVYENNRKLLTRKLIPVIK